ncbi:hypothetical protein, partial [Paraprevotella clara]
TFRRKKDAEELSCGFEVDIRLIRSKVTFFMDIPLVFSKILVVERIYFITFAKKLKRKEYAEEELLFGIGSRFERQ